MVTGDHAVTGLEIARSLGIAGERDVACDGRELERLSEAELAARIFEPFWTRRSEGAGGLGLAICKRIVEDAGGSIEVQSGLSGGACLRVELPFSH